MLFLFSGLIGIKVNEGYLRLMQTCSELSSEIEVYILNGDLSA